MRNSTRISRNATRLLGVAGLLLTATGCMTTGGAASLDEKFAAGWRPSKSYCTFGGPTPTIDAYCARVNFGAEGAMTVLRDVNGAVLQRAGGEELACTEHVAAAKERLAVYGDQYRVQELYSCDREAPVVDGRKVCHVSLLVTDAVTGARLVVDNGHVLNPAITGGVGTYAEFAQQVEYTWTGETPDWIQLSSR